MQYEILGSMMYFHSLYFTKLIIVAVPDKAANNMHDFEKLFYHWIIENVDYEIRTMYLTYWLGKAIRFSAFVSS